MAQMAVGTIQTTSTHVRESALLPGTPRLNHLQALEAESIYILREAAAEFDGP